MLAAAEPQGFSGQEKDRGHRSYHRARYCLRESMRPGPDSGIKYERENENEDEPRWTEDHWSRQRGVSGDGGVGAGLPE